jgi:hypothetical protein
MDREPEPKPQYQTPTVRVLDETEMLAQFQVTSAVTGWWF